MLFSIRLPLKSYVVTVWCAGANIMAVVADSDVFWRKIAWAQRSMAFRAYFAPTTTRVYVFAYAISVAA